MEFQKESPDLANGDGFVGQGVELEAEVLEEVVAPGVGLGNHNEMFVAEPIELQAEELEEVVAPGVSPNHNEVFAVDVN